MYSCGRPARRVTAPRAGECGLGESRKAGVTRPQPSQPPPFRANGEKRHAKEEAGSGQRGERASDGTVARGAGLGRHGSGPRASDGSGEGGATSSHQSEAPPFRGNREKRHAKEETGSGQRRSGPRTARQRGNRAPGLGREPESRSNPPAAVTTSSLPRESRETSRKGGDGERGAGSGQRGAGRRRHGSAGGTAARAQRRRRHQVSGARPGSAARGPGQRRAARPRVMRSVMRSG